MEIIVHQSKTLKSSEDMLGQFKTPLWEIEIVSNVLEDPNFIELIQSDSNYVRSVEHFDDLRSSYSGNGIVRDLLNVSLKDKLIDIAFTNPYTKSRFFNTKSYYQQNSKYVAKILKDSPGFKMNPHIDNNHVMIQMIVNLIQDNETSTEFYYFNQTEPAYHSPKTKNHGVVFVNTPGAIHSINGITKPRYILYVAVII